MKPRTVLTGLICCLLLAGISDAKKDKNNGCTTIQDGVLTYSSSHYLAGQPLKIGYDIFGYNYQAHLFNGSYYNFNTFGLPPYEGDDDAYYQRLVDGGFAADIDEAKNKVTAYWPYRDVQLVMKWNDAWLSNKDCDGDGKLDRHYGYPAYIGSGAWETNHMTGGEGKEHWTYFTKIIAVPADAYKDSGIWYDADGTEIGPDIWGEFATIMEVESGEGATYISPAGPGFGQYKP